MVEKRKYTKKVKVDDKVEELPEQTVFSMLEMAQAMTGGEFYRNILTTQMINERMKDMSLNSMQATESSLTEALKDPKHSEITLQGYSQDFEIQNQTYKRLIDYLGNMLAFDLTYDCKNIDKEADYKSKAYISDHDIVKKFLDRFDYKKEFPVVVRQLLRNEAFFASTRFEEDNIVFQELNSSPQYTMITGRSPQTLLFSFNMYWFIQPGVSWDMFSPFFGQKYKEVFIDNKQGGYNPGLPISERGNSHWVYWQDIPVGKEPYGWCFKMNPEIATRLPYFTGLMSEFVQKDLIRALQKNINMSVAARVVAGEVPFLKDQAAKVKDAISMTPKTLGEFLALMKAAIGESLKTVAMPLNNIRGIEFKAENDVYSSYLRNVAAMAGINSNLIYTNENRSNAVESQLSVGVDEQLIEKLYPQMNSFMNYHINKLTKKYKFEFMFEGTNNYTNRKQRFEDSMTLANIGIVLPQKIAAAIGMKPTSFERQLRMAKAEGFVDNLTPIISAFQQSGAKENGRPKSSVSDLGEAGEQTQASGSNEEK